MKNAIGSVKANTSHIIHPIAKELIASIRSVNCGLTKVYGSRYLQALAGVCNYRVYPELIEGKVKQVIIVKGSKYLKDSPSEAALFMERTIDDWYQLGILK